MSHFSKTLRPTVAEIDLSALAFNYKQLQKKIGACVSIMAIVKANAYGHGDVIVSRVLEKLGVSFLGVAYVEEGIRLRESGIKTPIVVLTGGQLPNVFPELHHYKLTPVFYDGDFLSEYNQFSRKKNKVAKVHLKFDTGMHRLGFTEETGKALFRKMNKYKNIQYEGMMMHFANAERKSHFNQEQILHFKKMRAACPVKFKYYHLANSGAILNDFGVNENLVRPGLTLYGAYPDIKLRDKLELKPVMTLKSQVVQLKKVKKGDFISYGYTHQFVRDSMVATVPIGYADGYFRHFSNKGEVLIRGKRASIVGVVCMDVFMVDVTDHQGVAGVGIGDEVVLIGAEKDQEIRVETMADQIQSIPWEIFCHIGNRVPRIALK